MRVPARGFTAAILFLVLACSDEAPPAATPAPANTKTAGPNLASFARGAVVTSRTGEQHLEVSAIHAIDDSPASVWVTPPNDPGQTMTVALPVRSFIERIGITMGGAKPPASITIEHSLDGTRFQPLAVMESPPAGKETVEEVSPVSTAWLRLSIQEPGTHSVTIGMLSASGKEEGSFSVPLVAGSWTINGTAARFQQDENRVRGIIDTDPPTVLEGAWSGRLVHFIYMRGNEYGLGALSFSPAATRLNGIWWYEKVKPLHLAPVWFGEKTGDRRAAGSDWRITQAWLSRLGCAPVAGLDFASDGTLQAASSQPALDWLEKILTSPAGAKATLRKRDLSQPSPEEGRAASARSLESLREELGRRGVDLSGISFQPLGAEGLDEPSEGPVAHGILSMVEIAFETGTPPLE